MRWCKKCLEPDTRPDCVFDDEGVCFPCKVYENVSEIDWQARRQELEKIARWAKSNRNRQRSCYDVIIPVSGGKDSHRQSLYAREELSLRPLLLTLAYPPEQQTKLGADNLANLIGLGFDCFYISPAPEVWRRMVRFAFMEYGNWCVATELALHSAAPKVGILYDIPLIIYGENYALTWGGDSSIGLDGDANRMKYSHTLKGGDVEPFLQRECSDDLLYWHRYPGDDLIKRSELRMIFLGYYLRDFNDLTNGKLAIQRGLQQRTGEDAILEDIGQTRTDDALDDDFVIINQMVKYFKFGFGKASEQLSLMVRLGAISRDKALVLSRRLDGKCAPRYIKRFCNYIGITEEEFWVVADSYRNPEIWERCDDRWILKEQPR